CLEWNHQDVPSTVAIRVLPRQLLHCGVHLSLRPSGVYARPHACDSIEIVGSAILRISKRSERSPNVHSVAVRDRVIHVTGMLNARRHHADNSIGNRVQNDLLPHYISAPAQPIAPDLVADNYDRRFAGQLIVAVEFAAHCRFQSQHVEKSGRDQKTGKPYSVACAGELQIIASVGGERFEAVQTRTEITKIVRIEWEFWKTLRAGEDPNQLVGIPVRQRS